MSAPGGVSALGGVCSQGVSVPWGVSALGGCLLPGGGGVSASGGDIPACTEADPLPPCEQNE